MAASPVGSRRVAVVAAVLVSAVISGWAPQPAAADVSAVKGSAFGVSAQNVTIAGVAQSPYGPKPTVTLPPGGSASPLTGHDAGESVIAGGVATLFTSGPADVSTQGTTGPNGSVTSSSTISAITSANGEKLAASSISSTCTASSAGVSGSTTVSNGVAVTSTDSNGNSTTAAVPANPSPGFSINGTLVLSAQDTESYTYVFNEQTTNPDGSLTVTAAHLILKGPFTKGDVYIGQSVCGATVTSATTSTTISGTTSTTATGATTTTTGATTTTAAAATTTSTAAASTTTTAPPSTSTTAPTTVTGVGGGAYGFFASVSLFGGPAVTRGPTPTVDLPAGGSATPVTASAPTGAAQYGPADIFSSDKLDVSTQGTTGPGGTVTSSATVQNVNKSGQEVFTAATASSSCSASQTAASGSTKLTGGKLTTSEGANLDSEADDVIVQLAADPAPNTSYDGKIETVGDTFTAVFNEQKTSAGSITVNAAHLYLHGPTAVGELIIGQSRCSLTASSGGSGTGSVTGTGSSTSAGGGGVARTGTEAARMTALALNLIVAGWAVSLWSARRRWRTAGLPGRRGGSWPRRSRRWMYTPS